MKCLICGRKASYFEHPNGPMCPRCYTGIKAFDFKPKRLGRAKKFLLGKLNDTEYGKVEVITETPNYSHARRRAEIKKLIAEQRADAKDHNYRWTRD